MSSELIWSGVPIRERRLGNACRAWEPRVRPLYGFAICYDLGRIGPVKLLDIVANTPIPIAYRIAFITNFYREPLLRRMEREFGVIRPEWTVLICLAYQDGLNPRDICEITEQPRNNISRAVASLATKGMVHHARDSADARRLVVRLTEKGRETYDKIMPIFVEGETKMLSALTPREQAKLEVLLDKICRSVPDWRQ